MNTALEKPSLAMFMSVDVVGSTAFKTHAVDESGNALWLEAFDTLFRELPLVFIGEVATAFADVDEVPESGVWKVLGDEILFLARPNHLSEAQRLFIAFARTVADYDRRIAERWPLRLRGCCFAAELGVRNRMVEIGEMFGGSDGRPYLDFLGPDIDTGFRLSGHSASGETIVSPNLVEAFAGADETLGLRFHALGYKSLKGVAGGQPFPLVIVSSEGDPAGAARECAAPKALAAQLAELRVQLRDQHHVAMAPVAFGG